MNKIQRKRFIKLIDFLKVLPKEKFDFSKVVTDFDYKNKCGTVCCSMGWTPAIFPNLVEWMDIPSCLTVKLKNDKKNRNGYPAVAEYLFGISYYDTHSLFTPNRQHEFGLRNIEDKATPLEVAKMLEKYLSKLEAEKK